MRLLLLLCLLVMTICHVYLCSASNRYDIAGGVVVTTPIYPFYVLLLTKGIDSFESHCGGVLVAPQWILTAGHCLDGGVDSNFSLPITELYAAIGIYDRSNISNVTSITHRVLHPQWVIGSSDFVDLAMVKLESPATHVNPIKLPGIRDEFNTGDLLKVIGFGSRTPDGSRSSVLVEADVEIVEWSNCLIDGVPKFKQCLYYGECICAGKGDGVDSCNGDSGGPLFNHEKNVLIGIVSYGTTNLCNTDSRGVYQNVAPFANWINNVTIGATDCDWCLALIVGAQILAVIVVAVFSIYSIIVYKRKRKHDVFQCGEFAIIVSHNDFPSIETEE